MRHALQLAGAVLLMAWPGWCADQKDKPAPPPKAAPAPKNFNAKAPRPGGGVPKNNVPRIANPGMAQRLLQMTPEQRERALEKLPPDRQTQMRTQLERLDKLPQAQKDHLAQMARGLDSLPPEQHRIVTQQLMAFNKLPDERIRPMRQELVRLMRMPEEERNARLNSEAFKKQYSPDEQSILGDLSRNLPLDYLPGR
ncbi:MAG TPA: DUF3106 domain-containing protein [Candidatus Sulfopaludibacter sp.]|jgi:hypothetical protein|nr:DUF3106 domain-containing protein [Candidatus Sulfopaludibacter sp.]